MLTDSQARLEALNPQQSFIVQAPAGSGKTELLTQRFLKLLSTVKAPEEIVAITFTRKAAAEMRRRIVSALLLAHDNAYPEQAHKQLTFKLACDALKRDQQYNWHIIDNPNRLRILTIDALAGFLSAQIPILAGFGSKPEITEQAQALYQQAAIALINSITHDTPWKIHIETLLLHLDNQASYVVDLLSAILAKREQWLPHILNYHGNNELLQHHLQQGLIHIVEEILDDAQQILTPYLDELISLGKHAAQNLRDDGHDTHPLFILLTTDTLLANPNQLTTWQALIELLLTQQDELRKTVDKRLGFLPKTPEKERIKALLDTFADDESIQKTLIDLRYCPSPTYSASQQTLIEALTELLPILYAQLRISFEEHNAIDFVELNLAALRALGLDDEPTDLALYLDHHIQHLLIDEFQDTSITQYTLLERLTRGWEPDDGRSLFLVGDPMQSIYRFRDAEVGLFIRAETQPINNILLTKLTLQNNYRSDSKIVEWINATFQNIFPKQTHITQGAIPYSPSLPIQNYSSCGIYFHGLVDQTASEEALTVVNTVAQLSQNHPEESIAILVRSRNQLKEIIPLLHANSLNFQAVDLETLIQCPEVQDLMTLTRVLLHREDRIAWYALLRSPICGLTLADLHALAQHSKPSSVWQRLNESPSLSSDGTKRLQRITRIFELYFNEQARKPFELALKGLWQTLGFPETLSLQQHSNCDDFFTLIGQLAAQNCHINFHELQKKLAKTHVKPQQINANLSIMTIHKSKGLEFDHVILPGLNNKSATEKQELMLWLEKPNQHSSIDLILAPIKQTHTDTDPIYRYLRRFEQSKLNFESARLLYVAATRAKKSLHLSACLATNKNDDIVFKSNSFADMLQHDFLKNLSYNHLSTTQTKQETPPLQRVPCDWQPSIALATPKMITQANPLPEQDNTAQRIIGSIIHELLADPKQRNLDIARRRMQQHGLDKQTLLQALDKIQIMLINIETDPRAQWILDPKHVDAKNEFPVTTVIKNKIHHLIIDRTFIDGDTRWIIDYKTAIPHHEPLETFLQRELACYRPQLDLYKKAMQGLGVQVVRTALYFPICNAWIECSSHEALITG